MISVLKKEVEKENNECRDVEVKAQAVAYWQTYLNRAK
jgi:hypothetical protein